MLILNSEENELSARILSSYQHSSATVPDLKDIFTQDPNVPTERDIHIRYHFPKQCQILLCR